MSKKNKPNKVSMFKVGQDVVLNNSSQNKVMKIQAYNDEFIRAYWSKKEYSFAHESNFRHATEQEIAAGHRIDKSLLMQHLDKCEEVVKTWPKWKLQSVRDAFGIPVLDNDMGDDTHIENHISPNCKVGVK